MNPDQKQLNVANEVLDILSTRFDDCVLAGGAPRDWSMGEKAKDLDFFVYGEMSVEQISELLGVEMRMLGEGKYAHSSFDVLEGVWEGETIQVIFTKAPTHEYIMGFPANCSRIWYTREGGFKWDNSFNHFKDLRIIIFDRSLAGEDYLLNKLRDGAWWLNFHYVFGKDNFLQLLGNTEGSGEEELPDEVNMAEQPVAPVVEWEIGNGILVNDAGDWEGPF